MALIPRAADFLGLLPVYVFPPTAYGAGCQEHRTIMGTRAERARKRLALSQTAWPEKVSSVHLHFDHAATGEIGQVLKALLRLNQIEVEVYKLHKQGYPAIHSRKGLSRLCSMA